MRRRSPDTAGRCRYCDRPFSGLFQQIGCAPSRTSVNVGFTAAGAGNPPASCFCAPRRCRLENVRCTVRHRDTSAGVDSSTDRADTTARSRASREPSRVTEGRHLRTSGMDHLPVHVWRAAEAEPQRHRVVRRGPDERTIGGIEGPRATRSSPQDPRTCEGRPARSAPLGCVVSRARHTGRRAMGPRSPGDLGAAAFERAQADLSVSR